MAFRIVSGWIVTFAWTEVPVVTWQALMRPDPFVFVAQNLLCAPAERFCTKQTRRLGTCAMRCPAYARAVIRQAPVCDRAGRRRRFGARAGIGSAKESAGR